MSRSSSTIGRPGFGPGALTLPIPVVSLVPVGHQGGWAIGIFLVGVGVLAGAMNALAGGGSFVTRPTLIAPDLPSVTANASSTIALYPCGAASALSYRDNLNSVCRILLRSTLIATLIGGFAGALSLLRMPSSTFDPILP